MFGIFAMCLFGSVFTFFKFFTLRGCFEGIRDCFKPKDGGYKGRFSEVQNLNSDWSVLHHHSDWSIRKPLKVKRSGKKERAHDGLMATIWTWSLLMTSSDNSKSPSARLENLLEKTFVENFRKWAAEIWFNLIAVPLNKINQKLNQHIPAACSFFHRVNNWFLNSISSKELWNKI